jgi:hypothetical protein
MKYQNHSMCLKIVRQLSVCLGMFGVALSALAQPVIESVTGAVQGGTEIVRIEFSQALAAARWTFLAYLTQWVDLQSM